MAFFIQALTAGADTGDIYQGPQLIKAVRVNLLCLLLMLMFAPIVARAADAPQIWFFMTNYGAGSESDGRQGWNRLFAESGGDWPEVMRSVKVIAAGKIEQVPDEVLKQAFVRLREHHVAFAVEILAQNWVDEAPCGHGVESYSDPAGAAKIAARIKAAGGRIDYIMMDEPLFYGHYYSGVNACHSSIDNVAKRAARLVAEYRTVFPDVIIGDNEPVPAIASASDWRDVYQSWLTAFKTASSRPISITHLDVDWDKPSWPDSVQTVLSFLSASNIKTGIIYNAAATGTETSDAWFLSAARNITAVHRLDVAPDDVVFQSWTRLPGRSFSDSHGLGEDYLLKRYLQVEGSAP